MATSDDGLSTFLSVRTRLFGVAYRILGCAAAAEDVVQDAWIRWQSTDRSAVRDAAAFLTTTASRLAINVRQSAHSRRETVDALCLPERVDTSTDQTLCTERADAVSLGVFMLLERLSTAERAAYILREAFDYTYRDIAGVLDVREPHARQLVRRARVRLAHGPRTPVLAEDNRRLLAAFNTAAQGGDTRCLSDLLAADTRCQGRRGSPRPRSRVQLRPSARPSD